MTDRLLDGKDLAGSQALETDGGRDGGNERRSERCDAGTRLRGASSFEGLPLPLPLPLADLLSLRVDIFVFFYLAPARRGKGHQGAATGAPHLARPSTRACSAKPAGAEALGPLIMTQRRRGEMMTRTVMEDHTRGML